MALASGSLALPPSSARRLYQSFTSAASGQAGFLSVGIRPRRPSFRENCTDFHVARNEAVIGATGDRRLRELVCSARLCCVCKVGRSDIISDLELEHSTQLPGRRVNGVFWIIVLNLGIFAADHFFQLPIIKSLYLHHARPEWFQFVTATFCHFNWKHLSSNLFFLYIFGKLVEEDEGNLGLWISYIVTGAGANLVSWLVLPSSAVSVGASGAVFGLFAVSVLVKLSWDWRKILEVLILGQFVVERVLEAAKASSGMVVGSLGQGSSMVNVNHIAHLSGALMGAALIYLITRIPSQSSGKNLSSGDRRS